MMKDIVEYLSNLGLDVIKGKIKHKIDEIKLKKALEEYIVKQHKYNDLCSFSEEIDN